MAVKDNEPILSKPNSAVTARTTGNPLVTTEKHNYLLQQ